MNTQEKFVVTVSREIGSGGHTVGKKLAEKLGVNCSDKELIHRLMDQFNLDAAEIERIKGEKKSWFNDFIQKVAPIPLDQNPRLKISPNGDVRHLPEAEELIQAERDILRSIAAEGSCVVVGRSGFEVLKDFPNKLDVFITAPRESRIKRVMYKQHLNEEDAEWVVDSVDKTRDNFIRRMANTSRYDLRNYDLVINSDGLTEDQVVDLILQFMKA